MNERYDHANIEKKWQEHWRETAAFETPDTKEGAENFYFLTEFPYPSGNLHVGHWYAFSVPDIFARYMRMRGYNVLYPIGFDAFGLPAENAAIQRKLNPRTWTFDNIEYMRGQLRSMGASFDWSREVITADPAYYKWTQWLFLKLYEKGLVYRKETAVNWCPKDKTVLANEQVVNGKCERCGSEVEQRLMSQWNIKITAYADRLIDDLKDLDWPKQIKDAQRNWIGRSEGAELNFPIIGHPMSDITVFTTRPDTLFGATYVVLAPEHPLVKELADKAENKDEVLRYIVVAGKKTELERTENKEKTGVELKGVKAINPAAKEEIPVWVADYVLGNYGTGAIMAVPAHDWRDFEFAKKFNLEIKPVIFPQGKALSSGEGDFTYFEFKERYGEQVLNTVVAGMRNVLIAAPIIGPGILINSDKFSSKNNEEAKVEITEFVEGRLTKQYHLRDWVVSRQRFWGVPIPMIHCEKCALRDASGQGYYPVPESDLPVVLPELEDYVPTGEGKSPLAKKTDWVQVSCPHCGGVAERETDTLDTFVDSSWYFLRYADPKNGQEVASKEKLKNWMPVDFYSGGSEHTTMHLLYSRFWYKAMFDMGLVGESEPYLKRMNRGLIMGPDGQKMSKSKGNVVDPDSVVAEVGADAVRMYLAFIGPYNEVGAYPWNPGGIVGVRRFLDRVWRLKVGPQGSTLDQSISRSNLDMLLHQTIKKVSEDIASLKMNTAVSALMILLNEFETLSAVPHDAYRIFLQLLAPFAPHLAHELAERANFERAAWEQWPSFDPAKLAGGTVTIAVQVNGKVRASIELSVNATKEEASAAGRKAVEKWIKGGETRAVYVPGKVINLVV
ncbi:MAG: leucine--tRNA ligase [Patescibacteria group bacterium]